MPSNVGGMDSILGWGAEIPRLEPKTKTKNRSNIVKKKIKKDLKKWSTCKRKKPLLLTQIKGWTPRVGYTSFARWMVRWKGKAVRLVPTATRFHFLSRGFIANDDESEPVPGWLWSGRNQDEKPHLIYDLCTVRTDRQTWAPVWVTKQVISNALSLFIFH